MINWLKYLWSRKTTAFGYIQISMGVFASSTNVLPPNVYKWVVLSNGLVTAFIGHYNNSQLKRNNQQ